MERSIPKNFEAKEVEQKWYQKWLEQDCFKPNKSAEKSFSMVMPPPNVTGKLHMGHALDNACQDIIVRHKRMLGFNTLWIPGTDHAGIATQAKVEKKIYQEEGKTKHDLGRTEFLKRIWQWKEQYGEEIIEQLKRLGASCDWDHLTFTMDETPNRAVRKVFTALYKEGLIYKDKRIINWDTVLQSAISDAEVEHKEVKGKFYHIHYKVKDSDVLLEIATTRPETLYGDSAVAVNPKDDKFKKLIGKTAIIPICNREVPIIGDSYVDMEVGTGCLKVTPGHDFNDFDIGKRHDLEVINILNPDGTLNNNAEFVESLSVHKARNKTIEKLEELNILIDTKKHTHQVAHGERSDSIIEPIVSMQWFLDIQAMAKSSVNSVKKGKMNFIPKTWENTLFSWLNEPRDWCLSRQLWWGHQIPVYTCKACSHEFASESEPRECTKCQSTALTQDPDVLDTWFSSGLWPLSTLGWPDEEKMKELDFETYFPNSTLVTGYDIIFFWIARMSMMSLKFMEQAPFKDVYIHGLVRDKEGRKMSKSLGNGIDPIETIDQFGCDAMRFTLAAGAGHNRGFNLDPQVLQSSKNFMNKIWNAFRFVSPFLDRKIGNYPVNLKGIDTPTKWIISELNNTVKKVNRDLGNYRFDEASSEIYSFIYEKFCSWYIELSKPHLYSDDKTIVKKRADILSYLFEEVLKLLHPISPFITEEIWSYFHEGELLISQSYPEYSEKHEYTEDVLIMSKFIEIVGMIRNLRASVQLSPKEAVPALFFTDDKNLAAFIYENRDYLNQLAKVSKGNIYKKDGKRPPLSIMSANSDIEVFLPIGDLIDIEAEKERIQKQLKKNEQELMKLKKKIENPKFIDNAPDEIVKEVKGKCKAFQETIDSLTKNFDSLSSSHQ